MFAVDCSTSLHARSGFFKMLFPGKAESFLLSLIVGMRKPHQNDPTHLFHLDYSPDNRRYLREILPFILIVLNRGRTNPLRSRSRSGRDRAVKEYRVEEYHL